MGSHRAVADDQREGHHRTHEDHPVHGGQDHQGIQSGSRLPDQAWCCRSEEVTLLMQTIDSVPQEKLKVNVPIERVRQQIASVLGAWGMDADLVHTTVEAIIYADLAGIDSHGVSMLTTYERYWTKGQVNFRARPRIVRENAVTALVDAGAGLGHPAAVMGMELANSKALSM